jgi:hypothetical protein
VGDREIDQSPAVVVETLGGAFAAIDCPFPEVIPALEVSGFAEGAETTA